MKWYFIVLLNYQLVNELLYRPFFIFHELHVHMFCCFFSPIEQFVYSLDYLPLCSFMIFFALKFLNLNFEGMCFLTINIYFLHLIYKLLEIQFAYGARYESNHIFSQFQSETFPNSLILKDPFSSFISKQFFFFFHLKDPDYFIVLSCLLPAVLLIYFIIFQIIFPTEAS